MRNSVGRTCFWNRVQEEQVEEVVDSDSPPPRSDSHPRRRRVQVAGGQEVDSGPPAVAPPAEASASERLRAVVSERAAAEVSGQGVEEVSVRAPPREASVNRAVEEVSVASVIPPAAAPRVDSVRPVLLQAVADSDSGELPAAVHPREASVPVAPVVSDSARAVAVAEGSVVSGTPPAVLPAGVSDSVLVLVQVASGRAGVEAVPPRIGGSGAAAAAVALAAVEHLVGVSVPPLVVGVDSGARVRAAAVVPRTGASAPPQARVASGPGLQPVEQVRAAVGVSEVVEEAAEAVEVEVSGSAPPAALPEPQAVVGISEAPPPRLGLAADSLQAQLPPRTGSVPDSPILLCRQPQNHSRRPRSHSQAPTIRTISGP